jgi:hypothetical protein
MSSYCCYFHHVARIWPRWQPGPSNQAYLFFPHLEPSPTITFLTCSSPAQTLVKLQPAPTILSQESVHTMLSITHHTWKWPSIGTLTTQVLSSSARTSIAIHIVVHAPTQTCKNSSAYSTPSPILHVPIFPYTLDKRWLIGKKRL